MLWILVVEGVSPRRVTLPPEAVEVGSGTDVGIRLEHPTVSRRHARFEPREGGVWVCDLGSSNGSRVRGRGVGAGALAADGEEVELGSLRCRIEAGDPRDFEPALALPGEDLPPADGPGDPSTRGPAVDPPASTLNVGSLRDFLLSSLPPLVAALEKRGLPATPSTQADGPPSAETVAVVQAAGRAILQGFPCRTVDVRLDGPGEALESVLFRGGDDIDDFDAPAAVEVRCRGLRLRVTFLPGFNGAAVEPVMSTVLRLAALAWRPAAAEPGPAGEDVEAPPPEPVTVDPSVRRLYDDARRVARGDVGVLILGESGTGKEVLARFIHGASRRRGGPWVALNCAALPEDLLEAELFGIERGVATGVEARAGTFELADGGTLFLDEIGDMAPAIQAKLLRVLQEGEVYRLGGRAARPARVRVISATNQDLRRAIDGGTFRLDLFHRIADCTFRLPPLRERRADLANLATHFLVRKASEAGVRTRGPSKAALECLLRHPWPGNIRQLEREMARAALFLEDGELLQTRHLQPEIRGPGPGSGSDGSLKEQLDSFERGVIVEALARHGGQARAAAEALGVSRTTFYRRLQELEIPT